MESILPTYRQFVELEWQTLKLLHDYLSQWAVFCHLAGLVAQLRNDKNPRRFQFGAYWDINYIDINKECRLFVGADVWREENGKSIANTSYCICLVEGTYEPSRVLRKFHFDYVTARPDRRQPHPRFHLQYCGGFPPAMRTFGIHEELMAPLLPDVDGPRIFFRPMSLALLMNIAFHEFPGEEVDEIRKRGEWQNIVRENERQILIPFYKRCAELAGRDGDVFFDRVYVH